MKKNLAGILVVFMFIVSCLSRTKTNKITSTSFPAVDQYLQGEITAGHLKGVHGLVYQNGEIIYDKTFGSRDNSAPMNGDEEYFIQSMTKPIISVGLMTLYEEGKFSLDDPIDKYLPEFSQPMVVNDPVQGLKSGSHPAKNKITIASLLSHTSGLSHGLTSSEYDKEITAAIHDPAIKTIADRVQVLAKMPLNYEPGTKWNYSFSTDVISRLIEVLSGMNTSDFIQSRVLQPLAMKNTGYNLNDEQQKRLMALYDFRPDSTLIHSDRQPSPSGNTFYAGVNGLFSTTQDYLSFARMLLNGGELNGRRILKKETIELMRKDATASITLRPDTSAKFYKLAPGVVIDSDGSSNLPPGYGFGLGFGLLLDPELATNPGPAGEFFWNGAYSTYFFINPKLNLIGIFMTQVGFANNPFHYYFGARMRQTVYESVMKGGEQ